MISSDNDAQLRELFTRAGADIAVPPDAAGRLRSRHYHPRQPNRRMVVGATAVAAAAGIVVPLALSSGTPGAAPVTIRFDSYTLTLPSAYHATAARDSTCRQLIEVQSMAKHGGPVITEARPRYGQEILTAASAAGGCIDVQLTSAYRPDGRDVVVPPDARPIWVGPYRAWLWQHRLSMYRPHSRFTLMIRMLYVRLPTGGGKVRDLVAGGTKISAATLIRVVAHGLSSRR